MRKTLSITAILILLLGLFFTQAFAVNSVEPGLKPKQTPRPGETETAEPRQPDPSSKKPEKAQKHAGKKYNFKGTVVSFDGSTLVLTAKGGESVTVTVDASTEIQFTGPKSDAQEIQPNQAVIVQAVKTDGQTYLALRIHVMPNKPQHIHRVGEVTAYEAGKSITVQDKKGSTTFQIAEDVKILPAERADMLKIGARVTIISPRDPSGGTPVARGIVVHPEKGTSGD